MDTKLTKLAFSQLGNRRNLWNLRFNELYLLSANPQGFRTSISIPLKNCVYMLLAKQSTQLWMLKVFTLCLK